MAKLLTKTLRKNSYQNWRMSEGDSGDDTDLDPSQFATESEIENAEENFWSETQKGLNDLDELLPAVAELYARELTTTREAQRKLEKLGLSSWEVLRRLDVGYSAGNLSNLLSKSQMQSLIEIGLFDGDKAEVLEGGFVVPLKDAAGKVVSLCGFAEGNPGFEKLLGQNVHDGLINREALVPHREEILVTRCTFDAIRLMGWGIAGVLPCFGSEGFTPAHLRALKDATVKKVVLLFETVDLKERLLAEGFAVVVVNADLELGREALKEMIAAAKVEVSSNKEGFKAEKESPENWVLSFGDVTYRAMGVKEIFTQDLKVTIKAKDGKGKSHYDKVDLYGAKSRSNFAVGTGQALDLEAKRIERHLLVMLEHFEEQRDKAIKGGREVKVTLSPEDEALGMAFLKSPDLMEQIEQDMEVLGYAGEEINKQLVYLSGVSRLLEKPLSVYLQAGSGAGKSYLLETLRKMLPPESVKAVTSFSDQALNYLTDDDLKGKVFLLGEAVHNEVVESQIRQMQSEGEIARLVTTKDPKTGQMKSREVRQTVQMSFMMSSTALELNNENASRCLILHVDESSTQTRKILASQGNRRTAQWYEVSAKEKPQIIRKHLCAQRLLEPFLVINNFAPLLNYPRSRASMRRSHEQFLSLIDSVCLLRQKLKTSFVVDGKKAIECDVEDYRIAYQLFQNGIWKGYGGTEMSGGTLRTYTRVRKEIQKRSSQRSVEPTDVCFSQRDVREWTGLGHEFVKKHLRLLVEFEYLVVEGGERPGTRWSYRLKEDAAIEDLEAKKLVSPERLEELLKTGSK